MLADVYKPHVSGVTHYIELNKRSFEKAGHEVFVFTFGRQEGAEPGVVRSPGLPLLNTGYFVSLSYSRRARNLLQSMDIAHIQHPFVTGRLALRYCQPLRIPTVFTNHTRYDLYARAYMPAVPAQISQSVLRAYMPAFCRAIDLVISPSAGMAEVLRGMGVTHPIEIVPNGVELTPFHTAEPLARSDFGYSANDVLLVYAGRVATEKNLVFLLRAFQGVTSALPNVHLLVIGAGTRPIEAELRQQVAELQLERRVRFIGMVPYAELPPYLRMCDAFVTASVSEVHPLSIIEAMAAGLPVVGIISPGVADTVEEGKTGLLATEDIPSLTARLTRLCQDESLRRRMGAAARQASAQYSIEITSSRLLGHYERLVQAARSQRATPDLRQPGLAQDPPK